MKCFRREVLQVGTAEFVVRKIEPLGSGIADSRWVRLKLRHSGQDFRRTVRLEDGSRLSVGDKISLSTHCTRREIAQIVFENRGNDESTV